MKLADLPRRMVRPLGEWPTRPAGDLKAAYRRYRQKNRQARIQYMRDYRARKAA